MNDQACKKNLDQVVNPGAHQADAPETEIVLGEGKDTDHGKRCRKSPAEGKDEPWREDFAYDGRTDDNPDQKDPKDKFRAKKRQHHHSDDVGQAQAEPWNRESQKRFKGVDTNGKDRKKGEIGGIFNVDISVPVIG